MVYLNGAEAVRVSMPAGPVTGTTLASSAADDGQGFVEIAFDPALLRTGTNQVAVELHQASATTSDASFDLELSVERPVTGGAVAFPIEGNTVVRARTLSGNQWSAMNEAFFRSDATPIAPGDLVIREMLVTPTGTNGTEYLELENVASRAVNLRGARFVEGVRYAFADDRDLLLAPGQRVLLVSDVQRFRYRYGREIAVAGRFEGSLDNTPGKCCGVSTPGEPTCSRSDTERRRRGLPSGLPMGMRWSWRARNSEWAIPRRGVRAPRGRNAWGRGYRALRGQSRGGCRFRTEFRR